jgi:hypothetical protein
MSSYWSGKAKAAKAEIGTTVAPVAALSSTATPGFVISVAPVAANATQATSFVVTVAPSPAPSEATADNGSTRAPDKVSLATLSVTDEK